MFNSKKFDELFKKSGLSVEDLADKSGLTRQTIWLLREGHSTDVRISTLQALASALDVEPSELMVEAA
jgi:DNA-binding Xre family transcriptional regulator